MQKKIDLHQGTQNDMLKHLNEMPIIKQLVKAILENKESIDIEELAKAQAGIVITGHLELTVITPDPIMDESTAEMTAIEAEV